MEHYFFHDIDSAQIRISISTVRNILIVQENGSFLEKLVARNNLRQHHLYLHKTGTHKLHIYLRKEDISVLEHGLNFCPS